MSNTEYQQLLSSCSVQTVGFVSSATDMRGHMRNVQCLYILHVTSRLKQPQFRNVSLSISRKKENNFNFKKISIFFINSIIYHKNNIIITFIKLSLDNKLTNNVNIDVIFANYLRAKYFTKIRSAAVYSFCQQIWIFTRRVEKCLYLVWCYRSVRENAHGIVFRAVCVFTGTSHQIPPVSRTICIRAKTGTEFWNRLTDLWKPNRNRLIVILSLIVGRSKLVQRTSEDDLSLPLMGWDPTISSVW